MAGVGTFGDHVNDEVPAGCLEPHSAVERLLAGGGMKPTDDSEIQLDLLRSQGGVFRQGPRIVRSEGDDNQVVVLNRRPPKRRYIWANSNPM